MNKLVIFSIAIISLSGCYITNTQKYYTDAVENGPYEAVIIPGVPFEGEEWQEIMKLRVHWAKYLYDQGLTENIVFSGSSVYTPWYESKIMALYAMELGIPSSAILLDTLAEHSTENMYYSWYSAKHVGLSKVALASDPFQSAMLKPFKRKMRRKLGADIALIPTVIKKCKNLDMYSPDIDPTAAFNPEFISIVDSQSKWERWRGTMGRRVDWKNPPIPRLIQEDLVEK